VGIEGLMADNSVVGDSPNALFALYVLRIQESNALLRNLQWFLHAPSGRPETKTRCHALFDEAVVL
jgi:hypothetical protein